MGTVRLIHNWAGALLSLVLIVLGLSGALLVFKTDYLRATIPSARESAPLDAGSLARVAERAESTLGAQGLTSVVFERPDIGLHRAYLKGGGGAYLDGQGNVLDVWQKNQRPEDWVFDLHHHLLSGKIGELVVGITGLAGLVLVFTGLITVWPARRMLGLKLLPARLKRRDLLSSHRNLGLVLAPMLLLMMMSGASMVFDKQARAIFRLLGPGPASPVPPTKLGSGPSNWAQAMKEAQAAFPDARIRIAIWPGKQGAALSVRLKQPQEWHPNGRSQVWLDPATHKVVSRLDAMAMGAGDRAYNALYPLHAGSVGGRFVHWLLAFTGLGLAILGGFGLWAFIIKPRKNRPTQRPPVPA